MAGKLALLTPGRAGPAPSYEGGLEGGPLEGGLKGRTLEGGLKGGVKGGGGGGEGSKA